MKPILVLSAAVVVALTMITGTADAGPTLDAVKARGAVRCGVHNPGLPGFSMPTQGNVWKGLDADICRVVAAAALGSARKVEFVPLGADQRFNALRDGTIDVLARNTTWTLTRSTAEGVSFPVITFYDGQGFLVPKRLGLAGASDLNGRTICVQTDTTSQSRLASHFAGLGYKYTPVASNNFNDVVSAFLDGRCDAMTSDRSQLAVIRATKTKTPDDYELLADVISAEPLAPAVRQGDIQWFNIVQWAVFATMAAEEWSVTAGNVDQMRRSNNPDVRRALGVTPGVGAGLGLRDRWVYDVIRQVGNYGEIYERNLGFRTRIGLPRGFNAPWTRGGLMYSPPLR